MVPPGLCGALLRVHRVELLHRVRLRQQWSETGRVGARLVERIHALRRIFLPSCKTIRRLLLRGNTSGYTTTTKPSAKIRLGDDRCHRPISSVGRVPDLPNIAARLETNSASVVNFGSWKNMACACNTLSGRTPRSSSDRSLRSKRYQNRTNTRVARHNRPS